MSFVKKEIDPKIIWIIDIGTYKIRVAITKYKNKDLELIWYWEKRQNCEISSINDIKLISKNIKSWIKKAEKNWNIKIKKIIINIPFEEIFFENSKVNYIRKDFMKKIDLKELEKIFIEIKKICLKKAFKNIRQNNSYKKEDLKLIISNIDNILIDKLETKKLLNKIWKEISISILNIFIPRTKYEIIKSIWINLEKKIFKIIPSEYSLSKLHFAKKNIIIIDLWKSYTSIIVKNHKKIIWVKKIAVWINDLIKEISQNYNKTKIEIINTIDENIYLKEKKWFLEIFRDILIISLEEIIWDKICSNNFFIIWWWSNKFIKDYLQSINFNKFNIKMTKKVKYISPNIEYLGNTPSSRSNLNIYSIMKCSTNFIRRQKDPIEDSLKKIMSKY